MLPETKLALIDLKTMTKAELILLQDDITIELDHRYIDSIKTAHTCLDLFFNSKLAINPQSQAEMAQLVEVYRSKRGVPPISFFYPNSMSDSWCYYKCATCCYINESGDLRVGDLAKCRGLGLTIVPFKNCVEEQ